MADLMVIGLGYVGLPVVVEACRAGVSVVGLDASPGVVGALSEGRSHVDDISDADVQGALDAGLVVTSDPAVAQDCDAIVICVPTPLSAAGGPDLSFVVAAAQSIAPYLASGCLVVLESTTYPGTTEEVVGPLLQKGSGLDPGVDFHLAFSPERIDPGNVQFGLRNTPKVVGGMTDACTRAAEKLYARFVDDVVTAAGTREAESAKLLENTYRHVNIALVNEMARFFHEMEIDFWDVIRLAATKPFGFQPFYPGPGVGGHCIPIDPNYLSHRVRTELGYGFRFVELAQEINATMPTYVAQRAQEILNDRGLAVKGSRILLLGVTYKANIADERESPAVHVAEQLLLKGGEVSYHDPFVDTWTACPAPRVHTDLESAVAAADLCILLQPHSAYNVDSLAALAQSFFDTRGVTSVDGAIRL